MLIIGAVALVASLGTPAAAASEATLQAPGSPASLTGEESVDGGVGIAHHCPSSIATPYRYTSPSGYYYVYQSTYNDCPMWGQTIVTRLHRYVNGSYEPFGSNSYITFNGDYAWNMERYHDTWRYRTYVWVELHGVSAGSSRVITCGDGKA
jgi:hypothetical protein